MFHHSQHTWTSANTKTIKKPWFFSLKSFTVRKIWGLTSQSSTGPPLQIFASYRGGITPWAGRGVAVEISDIILTWRDSCGLFRIPRELRGCFSNKWHTKEKKMLQGQDGIHFPQQEPQQTWPRTTTTFTTTTTTSASTTTRTLILDSIKWWVPSNGTVVQWYSSSMHKSPRPLLGWLKRYSIRLSGVMSWPHPNAALFFREKPSNLP